MIKKYNLAAINNGKKNKQKAEKKETNNLKNE